MPREGTMMKTTLELEAETAEMLERLAREQDRPPGDVIREALAVYLLRPQLLRDHSGDRRVSQWPLGRLGKSRRAAARFGTLADGSPLIAPARCELR
jgi:hypothetical protein